MLLALPLSSGADSPLGVSTPRAHASLCVRVVLCYGCRGMRIGEASNLGPVPALISIVSSNGDSTPLRLFDVGSRGHWRFQAQPYLTSSRRSSGDKLSPLATLQTWYHKHGKNLHPESQTHLEQLIKEHSGSDVRPQATQENPHVSAPPEEEATQWPENVSQPIPSSHDVRRDMQGATLPETRQFQQIAAMSLDHLLESRVMTQRHLPKASRDMFTQSIIYLAKQPRLQPVASIERDVILTMLLLLPRLVLPLPQETHPSRQHHKKQRILRERLILLYRG